MSTRFAGLNPSLRGPAMMVSACAGFAAMMAIVRKVSPEIHPFEAVFFRNSSGVLHSALDLLRGLGACAPVGRRCICCAPSRAGGDPAAVHRPQPDAAGRGYRAQLHRAAVRHRRRRAASARARAAAALDGHLVGFRGALIIIRPGVDTFTGASLIALASAAGIAAAQLSVKSLSRTEHPNAIVADHGPADDADVAAAGGVRLDLAERRRVCLDAADGAGGDDRPDVAWSAPCAPPMPRR